MAAAIYPAIGSSSPYEDILGQDFLFALRVLADDVPLDTVTIDRLLRQAVAEWFDETSRCRFSRYHSDLRERLAGLGGTRAAKRLAAIMDELDTPNPMATVDRYIVRADVLESLDHMSKQTVDNLLLLTTQGADAGVRVSAAQVLARRGEALSARVVAVLVDVATSDAAARTRVRAAQILAQFDYTESGLTGALTDLMTNMTNVSYVRQEAASMLSARASTADLENRVLGLLSDSSWEVQNAAMNTLTIWGFKDPVAQQRIEHSLAKICRRATPDKRDLQSRPGWDYAHETLRALAARTTTYPHNRTL
jgi:HEAT repeat protein